MQTSRRHLVTSLLIGLVQAYRNFLSPLYLPVCRYVPTCSAYAEESLRRHGAARGSWYTLLRLLRCHPLSAGGLDPVKAK
jgi:putative membrane protein insertion efficiency factor